MDRRKEILKLLLIAAVFAALYFLPLGWGRFNQAIDESLHLAKDYARQHVLLCLVPALLIAGGIATFIRQGVVMKYLGARANKMLAYGVASVSGGILAVCSCTVLPLFAGIYRMGAGLGPAAAFLDAGPAINVLAIVLTAAVLGPRLGIARAVGAVIFSIVIGLAMHFIYRREERERADAQPAMSEVENPRPLWKTASLFATMVGILVFANWARSGDVRAVFLCCPGGLSTYQVEGRIVERTDERVVVRDVQGGRHEIPAEQFTGVEPVEPNPVADWIYRHRWAIVAVLLVAFAAMVGLWLTSGQTRDWLAASWDFSKQILPLLLVGVLVAGFLLGRPGREGLIPSRYVEMLVGRSPGVFLESAGIAGGAGEAVIRAVWPVWTCLFAAVVGAFMYFATLTEVPILQGLIGAGMGHGAALSLLLAGPALSLPNMLVIRSVIGTRKTLIYVSLVVVTSTISGMVYGGLFDVQ